MKKDSTNDGVYEGTVRVVTEEDVLNDPRLVGASAVVGQLYDFSNLPYIKDGVVEANVDALNRAKDESDEARVRKADRAVEAPRFTSEAERATTIAETPEERKARQERDQDARDRLAQKAKEQAAADKRK